MAVSGEVEVLRCPLLLTFLTGGLGPTPGQREGKQAWVPITTTGAFIIQLTLRRSPGPGRAKGDVRAMCQGWGVPESPKLKKPGQTPCWATRQRGREDRKGGNNRAHKVRARRSGATAPKGFSPRSLHFPGPASSGEKSAADLPPPENLLSLTAPSSGQPSQFSQPPSCITYSCEPV